MFTMINPLQSGSVFYKRAKLTGALCKHIVIFTKDGRITLFTIRHFGAGPKELYIEGVECNYIGLIFQETFTERFRMKMRP